MPGIDVLFSHSVPSSGGEKYQVLRKVKFLHILNFHVPGLLPRSAFIVNITMIDVSTFAKSKKLRKICFVRNFVKENICILHKYFCTYTLKTIT